MDAVAVRDDGREAQVSSLLREARRSASEGHHESARRFFELACIQDDSGEAVLGFGCWLVSRGEFEAAEDCFGRLLRSSHQTESIEFRALAATHLAVIRRIQGDWDAASSLHQVAIRVFAECEPSRDCVTELTGMLLGNAGVDAFVRREWDVAERLFLASLHLEIALGNEAAVADDWGNLAIVSMSRCDWRTAVRRLGHAIRVRVRYGDHSGLAQDCENLAVITAETGRWRVTEKLLTRAQRLFDQLGQNVNSARVHEKRQRLSRYLSVTAFDVERN